MALWRGSRRYWMAEHHSRKMAASRRAGQIGLLLLSSLTLASTQGMYHPGLGPPWTWNNGAAPPPTTRMQSSTYRNGGLPHHDFTMSDAFNPIVPQRALDPGRLYSHATYLTTNITARTRTEGERAATRQSPSHGDIHEGNPLTLITNSSLSNAGKNPASVTHNESSSTSSQRSLVALDADAKNSNGQNMVAKIDTGPEVEAAVERAQEIPDSDIESERDATEMTTELSVSANSESRTSRSDSTGSSTLTHLLIEDPHPSPSTDNPYSTRNTATEENSSTNSDMSAGHVVNSEEIASELDAEESSLDTDQHRMRRSAGATMYRRETKVSPHLTRNSRRSLPVNNFKGTPCLCGSGPAILRERTSAEEFTDSLTRLRQIAQEFVDIYQEFVPNYSPSLKTISKIPSLEEEISSSENYDNLTETGSVSDIQYAVAKGKHLIELYHRNLNVLRRLSLKATAKRDNSPHALDDTLKAAPSIRVVSDKPSSQVLGQSDLDLEVGFHIDRDGQSDINSAVASDDIVTTVPSVHIMLDEPSSQVVGQSVLDLEVGFHIDEDGQSDIRSPDELDDIVNTAPSVHIMLNEPSSQELERSDFDHEVGFHTDEDGQSDINSPGALDDIVKTAPSVHIKLDEPSSQELERSDLGLKVGLHIDEDGQSDINSSDALDDSAKTAPSVHIVIDEPSSQELERRDLDLEVGFHIDEDGQSNINSSDALDDTVKTAPNVHIMLDEPSSLELERSDLDLEVGFHIAEDDYSDTVTFTPTDTESFTGSHPNGMVRRRRSADQKSPEPLLTTNTDEVPLTRSQMSQVTDEIDNYRYSFDEPVARIGKLTDYDDDDDESFIIRKLGHSSSNQQGKSKSKSTENDVVQPDSTENSLPSRLMVERDNSTKMDTSYTKLLVNIRESTLQSSKIKDLFERMATIPHDKNLQGLDFAGNEGRDNTLYLERKANASVGHILSKYSTELSDILESILAEGNDTVVTRALLVYYLAKHKLLNNLLLKNVAHVAKSLNETNERQQPFMASRIAPVPTGVTHNQYRGEQSSSPKLGEMPLQRLASNPPAISDRQSKASKAVNGNELPLQRLASNPPAISDRQSEASMDVSVRNDLQMFSKMEDDTGETSRAASIENILFPTEEKEEKVETLDPKTSLLPPVLPDYGPIVTINEAESVQNSTIASQSRVASTNHTDLNTTMTYHNGSPSQRQILNISRHSTQRSFPTSTENSQQTSHTQNKKPFHGNISQNHQASKYFSGKGTSQQTMKSWFQQPFPANNTKKYQTQNEGSPQQISRPQFQKPFTGYNTQKYQTQNEGSPQQIIRPQFQQPFTGYNTQKYQTQNERSPQQIFRPQFQKPFPANNTQKYQTQNEGSPQQFISPQFQQQFPAYTTQKYHTPKEGSHHQTITPQFQQPFTGYNTQNYQTQNVGSPQQTIKPQIQQQFPAHNTQKYHTYIHPQSQQQFVDYDSLQHLPSQYFPVRESSQQALLPQTQQPLSTYNTPKDQSPIKPQIQQGFLNYSSPQRLPSWYFLGRETPQYGRQPHIQQPLPANNSPQHQTPLNFPQPQIYQPLPAYNIPQHPTSAYFPEPQIQLPFSTYNTPHHPTPVLFPETQLPKSLADSSTRYFSSTATLREQYITLHASTQAWETNTVGRSYGNHITPNFEILPITKGEQNKELVPVRSSVHSVLQSEEFLIIIETPTEFLQSEWLHQMLRNNYVKLLCGTLVEGSKNDFTVDRKLYTDSFSAVVADYILRLFDYKAGVTSNTSKQTTLRRRRHLSGASGNIKRYDRGDVDSRFSSLFLSTLRDPNQTHSSAATKNSYSEILRRLLHSSNADPLFYTAFYKYCTIDTNSVLNCTPSRAEYKGPAPAEVYHILKYLALQRTIPNLCSSLFA